MPLGRPTGHRHPMTPAEVSSFFSRQMAVPDGKTKGPSSAWMAALHGKPSKGVKRKLTSGGRP